MPSAKRQNVISWDEFFMRVAIAAQLRSKDPNTQVGIGEVVYLDNKYADTDDGRISRRILDSCGITYRQVLVDA